MENMGNEKNWIMWEIGYMVIYGMVCVKCSFTECNVKNAKWSFLSRNTTNSVPIEILTPFSEFLKVHSPSCPDVP